MTAPRLERTAEGRYRLIGSLTVESVPALLAASTGMLGAGQAEIDCAGIEHADSAAVALMLEWLRQAEAAGGQVVFRDMPERLRAIVALSDLDEVIPLAH
ncbi:MAG: STAS domain-containing protein [Chromatiales bacterium]|nr:STAS domain-containing protein [Chromatiales bacterium]